MGTSGGFGVYGEYIAVCQLFQSVTYRCLGFEYFSNPEDRGSGHITWVANGKKSWTMFPDAVGAVESMDIGQRLISEEPMAMVCQALISSLSISGR